MLPGTWQILILLIILILYAYPAWRIVEKTGLPAPLGVLMIIPGINLLLLWVLALTDWPVLKKA